ncbi:MAG: M48 family metallopeptidase [Chloroflexota bacterium]
MKKYRHPKETTAMFFTFGIGIVVSLFFATVTLGCGLFLLGLVFAWGYFTFFRRQSMERYIPVTGSQHPDIWQLVQDVRKKWRLPEMDIYLNPTRKINAAASDFGKDFIIINHGLWSAITGEAHRKFVIGHELGHIGMGHSWLSVLAYQADNAFQGTLLGIAFQFLLLNYSRKKELSADRIGLLSSGSLQASLETLAFLELSPQNPSYEDVKQAVMQLARGKTSMEQNMAELLSTHPDAFERVQELIKFARQVGVD